MATVALQSQPVSGSRGKQLQSESGREYHSTPAMSSLGPGQKGRREVEQSMRCGLVEQPCCTCENGGEDDSTNQLSGWDGHPVSLSAQHTTLHSTTTAPVSSTSNISHGHSSSNQQRSHSNNTSQCGKSNSKHQTRILTTTTHIHEIPDIPFNMAGIHSNSRYSGLENSSAHIEHYLSSYTYPHLEQMLAESLSDGTGILCSHCAMEPSSLCKRHGLVKPSIVRVLLEESVSQHNPRVHHRSVSPNKSTSTFKGVHSTPSVPHPRLPSSINIGTSSSKDTHTVTTRPHKQETQCTNNYSSSLSSKTDWKQVKTSGSYNTAKHVYDMGVRWIPQSFPSFVVYPATSKPPHKTGKTTTTNRKLSSTNTSPTSEYVGKNTRVPTPLARTHTHVRGKKRQARKYELMGEGCGKAILTKTLSPFPITSSSQPSIHSSHATTGIPPIKPQNQGLLATRREFSHLLRHKKSVSFHSGRPSFHYESLCLEGHSATSTSEASCGDVSSNSVAVSGHETLPSDANTAVKIPGPWIK